MVVPSVDHTLFRMAENRLCILPLLPLVLTQTYLACSAAIWSNCAWNWFLTFSTAADSTGRDWTTFTGAWLLRRAMASNNCWCWSLALETATVSLFVKFWRLWKDKMMSYECKNSAYVLVHIVRLFVNFILWSFLWKLTKTDTVITFHHHPAPQQTFKWLVSSINPTRGRGGL